MEHAVANSYDDINNTFIVPCEKPKIISFASSIMKNNIAPSSQSRFPVKLICCIAFGSALSACCLRKSIAIILNSFWNNYSPAGNHLWSHLLDLLQFFECYNTFSYYL